jgi:hypothetical protein
MTLACSLSDTFRLARTSSVCLFLTLVAGPHAAQAQAEPPAAQADPAPQAAVAAAAPDEPPHHHQHKHAQGERADSARDDAPPSAAEAKTAHGVVFSSAGGSLQIKGRIFALAELSRRPETIVTNAGATEPHTKNSLDLSLASARIGVAYRSPLRWLSAELELEIAGKPKVKDAYVLAGKRFFVKAGQFKIPTAELDLESPWALPQARRGLIHDLLTDWLDVAGRRPGVAVGYRGKGAFKPRLTLGAFQGSVLNDVAPGDRDVTLIDHASLEAQSFAARAEAEVVGIGFGAWYEQRVGSRSVGRSEHFATLGLDATYDHSFERGGVRAWLDGSGGQSFYVNEDKRGSGQDPIFVAARALAGYRFGGVKPGEPFIEPFGFFGLLDPDTEVVADFVTEAALGINAGFWDRARLTLQAERANARRNFPTGLLARQNPDRSSLLLQAGARF